MNSLLMTEEVDSLIEPASWLIKTDFINQFILNHNVLISLLGEQGGGKTTFAHLLQDKLDQSIQSVLLTTSFSFDRTLFLGELCSMIDMEEMGSIATIAAQINEKKSRTLIMIDDAGLLPESFIRELLDVLKQQKEHGYFHVCLFSDFSIVNMTSRLAREDYKDMIHSIELQPLNEEETNAYVKARLSLNPDNTVKISDKRMQQFFEMTEGYIAVINDKMSGFFSNNTNRLFPLSPRFLTYGAISALMFLVVGVGYILYSPSALKTPEPVSLAKNAMDSIQIELPMVSDIPFYQRDAMLQPMQMVSLQKAERIVRNEEEEDSPLDESLVIMDKVVPVPKVMSSVISQKALTRRPTKKVTTASVGPKPNLRSKSAIRLKAKPHSNKLVAQSGKYTIQLLASRDKTKLSRLAKHYPGIKMQGFEKHGAIWYVLTKGDFADKQLAKNALKSLPKNLAQFKPWIRSTSNLKAQA
jgi:DamX protein